MKALWLSCGWMLILLQVNGRKRTILSLPASLVEADDGDELRGELVRCALREGVIREEGKVKRVVIVPHRQIANIVT